jgi:hypothetical protein
MEHRLLGTRRTVKPDRLLDAKLPQRIQSINHASPNQYNGSEKRTVYGINCGTAVRGT